MKKRVLSLMLATVMCMALAVTANAVEYDSSISRYYGTGNCSYTAYSALYADGGSRYRAATWVETMNGGNVAAGNMGANGRLYSASGTLLKDTGMMYNTSSYYFQDGTIRPPSLLRLEHIVGEKLIFITEIISFRIR